jgi:peptidoglycan hydrolase CwlO-like protein
MEEIKKMLEEFSVTFKLMNGKLDGLQKQMDTKFAEMRSDMNEMRSDMNEMRSDMNEMRSDMNGMRSEMDRNFVEVKSEVSDLKTFTAESHQATTIQIARLDRFSRVLEQDLDKTILKVEKLSESKSDYNIED